MNSPGRLASSARRGRRRSARDHAGEYEQIALVMQGGGALGAYQCGVYEALHEADIQPGWFAGTSIGAINAAIIAGNAPADRIDRLRAFWNRITRHAGSIAWPLDALAAMAVWMPPGNVLATGLSATSALGSLGLGQNGFFEPRGVSPLLFADGSAQATSFYDTAPLKDTLERLIDFDRINHGEVRLSVGAANVNSGNVRYFDSAHETLCAEHIMASAALPPAFPAIEIDGEFWWDGGIVSNTPLDHVLAGVPRHDSLVLQVDLWSARGLPPKTIMDVLERQKDIQYSSRTRFGTDTIAREQKLRNALGMLIEQLPGGALPPALQDALQPWLCDRVFNIVHLIYQAKHHEEQFKDYAFAPATMREHWSGGLADMRLTLQRPQFFELPSRELGVVTHDIHRTLAAALP
ncbi:MAG: patatin-like phospholipase family protein [Dokdonella sp.]|uniref:patatin-like phospholipase family protein n=1 Tax=Dokdonella sp. TaxID=2291710 RepID=UPI003BB0AD9E